MNHFNNNGQPCERPPRPARVQVIAERIPAELRSLARWVLWRWEWNSKKWTKPPYRHDGRKANKTSPDDWLSFEEALAAYETEGFDGVGFCFVADDDIAGVDLDDCRDPATGELTPDAKVLLDRLGSYTEVSPSGTGVKIFVHGKLMPNLKHLDHDRGIELYEAGAYFCVTGHQVEGTSGILADCVDVLPALHAEIFYTHGSRRAGDQHGPGQLASAASALASLSPDMGYSDWISVGMALHSITLGKEGFEVWDEWSARGQKYQGRAELETKWNSFKPGRITAGTLYYKAKQAGWTPPCSGGENNTPGHADAPRESNATTLVNLADDAELFHTPGGEGFARVTVENHKENWPLKSKGFKDWLRHRYYKQTGGAPSAQAVNDAIGALEARARFGGVELATSVRIAEHDGKYYLDLCDPTWRAIEIGASGWRIIEDPPVRFRRAKAMLPLSLPVPGGSVDQLREFINVDDHNWRLIVGFILASLRPRGPYPVLVLLAQQGSGKSTTARQVRSLLDPNAAPLRSEPREARDLMIAANNGWIVALDNLSHVSAWLSDALCRLSTGGGYSTRTLYENDDETIFDATRPVLVTAIDEVVTRGDLLDRSLIVPLPTIPVVNRRTEDELSAEFERALPRILGALLDVVSAGLQNLPTTRPERLPRMADFVRWISACEPALGWPRGSFIKSYDDNRSDANAIALDASPIAPHIRKMVEIRGTWSGTPTELLSELEKLAGYGFMAGQRRPPRGWPPNAQVLSTTLKRLTTNLYQAGIDVVGWREPTSGRRRMFTVTHSGTDGDTRASNASTPSGTSQPPKAVQTKSAGTRPHGGKRNSKRSDAVDATDAKKRNSTVRRKRGKRRQ